MSPAGSPMMQQREKARRIATNIVAVAMGLAGLTLLVLAVVLGMKGGAGLVFLAILLGLMGVALMAGGFFFQLVPLRVDELAQEKRDYDRRAREEQKPGP